MDSHRPQFALGAVLAVALFAGLGELYARFFPPSDTHRYLGDRSPLCGPFAPDPVLGVRHRDWDAFAADHPCLPPFAVPGDPRPTWLMFGNSFVQAPGMLADTARAFVPSRRVVNLGRNEYLNVRIAQAALLLDRVPRPECAIVNLMPLDTAPFGSDPLDRVRATPGGGMGFEPNYPPGPLGRLVAGSGLLRAGWFRSGRHHAEPDFHPRQLTAGVPPRLLADLETMFAALAAAGRRAGVPVTVLLTPTHEQVVKCAPPAFQDAVAPAFARLGLDVCDVRPTFAAWPAEHKPALFIPDKHFSPAGNVLLLTLVLDHLRSRGVGVPPPVLPGGRP